MANLLRTSFEMRNVTYETVSVVGSPEISTAIYFKGIASLRCNASGSEVSAKMRGDPGSAVDNVIRTYVRFVSFPDSLTKIIQLQDASGDHTSIRVNSDGTLELWDDPAGTQAGSDSSALSLNTWYR